MKKDQSEFNQTVSLAVESLDKALKDITPELQNETKIRVLTLAKQLRVYLTVNEEKLEEIFNVLRDSVSVYDALLKASMFFEMEMRSKKQSVDFHYGGLDSYDSYVEAMYKSVSFRHEVALDKLENLPSRDDQLRYSDSEEAAELLKRYKWAVFLFTLNFVSE